MAQLHTPISTRSSMPCSITPIRTAIHSLSECRRWKDDTVDPMPFDTHIFHPKPNMIPYQLYGIFDMFVADVIGWLRPPFGSACDQQTAQYIRRQFFGSRWRRRRVHASSTAPRPISGGERCTCSPRRSAHPIAAAASCYGPSF